MRHKPSCGTHFLRRTVPYWERGTWRSLNPTAAPGFCGGKDPLWAASEEYARRAPMHSWRVTLSESPPYLLPNNQCDTLHTREPSTQCPLKLSLQPTGNSSRVLLGRVCPNANLTSLTGTSPFSVKKAGTDDDSQGNINTKCTSASPVDISAAKDYGSISTERTSWMQTARNGSISF